MSLNEDINLEEYKDSPIELFEKLLGIWRQEIRHKNKKSAKIIVELNKKHGVDFCKFALQALDEGDFNCFDIYYILADAIPFLNLNVTSTFEYLKKLHNSMKGDLFAGIQYSPIASLTNEQPQFARELLNILIDSGETFIVGYISTIFENFAKTEIENIHNELLTLILHPKEPVVKGVIIALGSLKYDTNVNKELVKKTLCIFDKLLERESDSINQAIAVSLDSLHYLGNEIRTRLMSLAEKGEPQTCYQISRFLFHQYKNINDDKWLEKILMTFSAISCKYKHIIDNIDYILCGLLEDEKYFDLVERFFTTWFLNSDYHQNQYKLDFLFGATLSKLLGLNNFFDMLITKYLNHDNYKIHQAASDLIQYSNLYKNRIINLDEKIIQSLDIQDILYVSIKILGYILDINTICSLVYSILTAKANDAKVRALVHELFLYYIGMDYPRRTLEFLKNKLANSHLSDELKTNLKSIIDPIESRQKMLKSLPRLNELSISKKIPLKYGKSWFSYREGKYSEPIRLSSFSHSVELPVSEIYNPVSASIQRFGFRLFKRGK